MKYTWMIFTVLVYMTIPIYSTQAVEETRELPAPVLMPSPDGDKKLTGLMSVGYLTNYNLYGLVPAGRSGENATELDLHLNYRLNDQFCSYLNTSYTNIWQKDKVVSQDQYVFQTGLAYDPGGGWNLDAHYGFVHGGLLGAGSRMRGYAHEMVSYLGSRLTYEDSVGLFFSLAMDYYVSYDTGWRFDSTVGYKYKLTDKYSAVVELGSATAVSYYSGRDGDGMQSVFVKFSIPCRFAEHITMISHVGPYWLASGAVDRNKEGDDHPLRNFTWVAGVKLIYTF